MSDKIEARRAWIARIGLMYRGEKSLQRMFLQAGDEVTDITNEDLASFIKRGCVEQKLVEA